MPNKFRLVFTNSFRKDFRKIPVDIREKIIPKLKEMQINPLLSQVKQLKKSTLGKYRKRAGDYRITFDIIYKNNEIWFYQVKHRKDIYRHQ